MIGVTLLMRYMCRGCNSEPSLDLFLVLAIGYTICDGGGSMQWVAGDRRKLFDLLSKCRE